MTSPGTARHAAWPSLPERSRAEQSGAERSKKEQKGAKRSKKEQKGTKRNKKEQKGTKRNKKEQEGAGRSREEQGGAGRSSIADSADRAAEEEQPDRGGEAWKFSGSLLGSHPRGGRSPDLTAIRLRPSMIENKVKPNTTKPAHQ